MKTDRELMQQALDDLMSCSGAPHWPVFQPTITALRERLAQLEQEPVAWVADGVLMKIGIPEKYTGYLYTAPPAAQAAVPWRMIVTEEMHIAACKVLTRANGLDGLPQRMLDAMLASAPEVPAAQRQPLTEERIFQVCKPHWDCVQNARAIEAAHGITGEKK